MATTDARTGFRLPWSTDQRQASEPAESSEPAETGALVESAVQVDSDAPAKVVEATDSGTPVDGDPVDSGFAPGQGSEWSAADADPQPLSAEGEAPAMPAEPAAAHVAPAAARSSAPARRQNKFLADLTKAMQAAAEAAREDSVARFAADAKAFVEQIHTRSAEESADLRRRADDDINQIRDWSKAEIARIREETEQRIADRRNRLEHETETHAAQIEHEIERVQGRVAGFEAEMARFFERLLAEDDPTRFAALAENLPEPPSFDVAEALAEAATWTAPVEEATPIEPDAGEPEETVVVDEAGEVGEAMAETVTTDRWATLGWSTETAPTDETPAEAPHGFADPEAAFADPEAAFAAIQAAAEAAEATGSEAPEATDAAETAETPETAETEPTDAEATESLATEAAADPRLEMLGLNPDFAAAEAEAFAIDATDAEAEEIPQIGEEALAARLAGFLPGAATETAADTRVTRVVVLGLVSVASIASFKRHLGRLPGVQAVGVSSGPDGEFVFAVTHVNDVVLADSVPTLPGFQARVTGSDEGLLNVTAHDPESDA